MSINFFVLSALPLNCIYERGALRLPTSAILFADSQKVCKNPAADTNSLVFFRRLWNSLRSDSPRRLLLKNSRSYMRVCGTTTTKHGFRIKSGMTERTDPSASLRVTNRESMHYYDNTALTLPLPDKGEELLTNNK